MISEDKRIDDAFSERRTRPESSEELAQMQRVFPDPLPATHAWEYRWKQPSAAELAKNPRRLPELVQGVRELRLGEVREATKDFQTLDLAQLRWLQERHGVQMPPFEKGQPRKDDATSIREALLTHAKDGKEPPAKPAVQARTTPKPQGATVLPSDIAGMDDGALETEAAKLGVHDEYVRLPKGAKDLPMKRAWVAERRQQKQPAMA